MMKKNSFFVRNLSGFLFAAVIFLSAVPMREANAAGLVPCGTWSNPQPCTLCHLVVGVKGVIDWGMNVMTFFAIAIITAMGIVYIVSAGNSGMMTTAKTGIKNTLIGFAVMLGSWVIVNLFMTTLANSGVVSQGGDWSTFTCDTSTKARQTNPTNASQTGSDNGTSSGTGKCDVLSSGPCSEANLKEAFGNQAAHASAICSAESGGGDPGTPSLTDRCKGGESFSIGLFQINLTVHEVGGLNCPSAFTGKNYDCVVRDPNLYNQCVAAASDSTKNIAEAVKTYKIGKWNQWGANKRCGF